MKDTVWRRLSGLAGEAWGSWSWDLEFSLHAGGRVYLKA